MFTQTKTIKKPLETFNIPKCNFYVPSIFDEFLNDGQTRCSDITFLFNQQRLDKMITVENFNQYFDKLKLDAGANPYEGMSDDEILQFVKDRRLSSFNDWYNYTRCLVDDCSDLERYKSDLEARQASYRDKVEKFKSMFSKKKQSADADEDADE